MGDGLALMQFYGILVPNNMQLYIVLFIGFHWRFSDLHWQAYLVRLQLR
jgi:hypothetical protein